MAVDAQDNVWICDENGDTVMKVSPEGKLLMTLGVPGRGEGQFVEASYLVMDSKGKLFTGDTSVARITELVAPKK